MSVKRTVRLRPLPESARSVPSAIPVLLADSCPDSCLMRVIYNHLDHTQYRLMMRIIELVQLCVLTVDRQCILCQVIGSDTEEINLFRAVQSLHH